MVRSAGGSGTRLKQLLVPHTGEKDAAPSAGDEATPSWLMPESSGASLLTSAKSSEASYLISKVVTTRARAFAGGYAPMIAGPTLLCVTRDASLCASILKVRRACTHPAQRARAR